VTSDLVAFKDPVVLVARGPLWHAFEVWATRTSLWWPHSHSRSGDPGLTVTIEPRPGGRIYERTPAGVEHDWGEVLAWEPPARLAYLWHIYGQREDATQVDIRFAASGDATTVTIVHRGWERLGARADDLRRRTCRAGTACSPTTCGPASTCADPEAGVRPLRRRERGCPVPAGDLA
jgi:uncharacterized protein YndB with AHSA1/START domain